MTELEGRFVDLLDFRLLGEVEVVKGVEEFKSAGGAR